MRPEERKELYTSLTINVVKLISIIGSAYIAWLWFPPVTLWKALKFVIVWFIAWGVTDFIANAILLVLFNRTEE